MRVQETRNTESKVRSNSNTFQRQVIRFIDNRPSIVKQLKLQNSTNDLIQRKVDGAVVQRAVKEPTMTGSNHGQTVKLNLAVGDTVNDGGTPSVDPDGYDELRTIKQSHGKGAPNWVRFHVLNAKAGGPGNNKGNLTPATGKGNHSTSWTDFETDIKTATANALDRPLDAKIKVNYKQSKTVYWSDGTNTTTTNNKNYPNSISAELDSPAYPNKTYSLDSGDDLGKVPQQFNNSGWKAYSDSMHTTQIDPD